MHAELIFDAIKDVPDGEITWALFTRMWKAKAQELYNGAGNAHHIMENYYIDLMTEQLWAANNYRGSKSDYTYWAYQGLDIIRMIKNNDIDTIITKEGYAELENNYWQNIHSRISSNDCN